MLNITLSFDMVCSILYWVLVASLFLAVRAGSKTSDDTAPCSSFKINGSWDATFSFHRSWDFRNVKRGTKEDLDGGSWPPSEAEAATADPFPLSRAVSDQSWTDDWTVREWYREAAQPGLAALHYVPKMVSIGQYTLVPSKCRPLVDISDRRRWR